MGSVGGRGGGVREDGIWGRVRERALGRSRKGGHMNFKKAEGEGGRKWEWDGEI